MEFNDTDFASMAHEFKTPINVISSTAQVVIKANHLGRLSEERLNDYMVSISHYCNKLELLTNNILDLYKDEQSIIKCDYETLDVQEFLEDLIKSLLPYAQKFSFSLKSQLNFKDTLFSCDFIKLERILLNLISNAVKYNSNPNKEVYIIGYDEENYMVFAVKDNGIGIPYNMHDKIREKFFRVESVQAGKVDGCGLGLPIVEFFLQLLGGRLEVKSTVGKGSEFTIYLPKTAKPSKTAEEPRMGYESCPSRIEIELSSIC